MREAFKQTALKRTMDWAKHNDTRSTRIAKYNENQAIEDREVW